MIMLVTSPKWTILPVEWQHIAKGLGITLLGAGLAYLSTAVTPASFGSLWWSPLAVVVFSTLVDIGVKYVRENQVLMEIPEPKKLIVNTDPIVASIAGSTQDEHTGTPTNS